ncbi:hypothetical protein GCM10017673_41630 [Streptosporangium violaceochromogenes]|nr:hypothetical protein GCM10017673_41630 [Streptosporangium violaceochromogenes]
MRKLMAVGAAVMAFIAMSTTPANAWPTVPPPDKIIIDVVTVNGSGCRPGTTAVAVSPDNMAFTVTYSDFLAQVGVGAKPTDFRKNCQLNLLVHVPQGFTYAVAQTDYRGFAHLEDGASGEEKANYYFQGHSQTTAMSHKLQGPFENNWQNTDVNDVAQLVYMPCGELRSFNINTELRVNAGTSDTTKTTSFMTMDSTDANISTTYHFSWKQCPAA